MRARGHRRLAALACAGVVLLLAAPSAGGAPADASSDPGLGVSGRLLLRDGEPFLPRGFNLIGLLTPAWCDRAVGVAAREHFGPDELAAAASWSANTLRFQVSQRGLADPGVSEADRGAYLASVVERVAVARAAGFVVIVSMQDQAYGCGDVHPLPSTATVDAWTTLAPELMADPYVAFELFNEPRNEADAAGWAQWRDGGSTPDANLGDGAVGHQALVDLLRGLGATNLLIADAARLGERTTGMPRLADPLGRMAYGIHPYYYSPGPSWWDQHYGDAAAEVPLIATEWNYLPAECGTAHHHLAPDLLDYLRRHHIGVLGHAFDIPGTTVADWNWTPTRCGGGVGGSGEVLRTWFASLADRDVGQAPTPAPLDSTPPNASATLSARLESATQVTLRWSAASDDVGVTGYRITRDGEVLRTVTGRTTTDIRVPTGSHTYGVSAIDAAGNASTVTTATVVAPTAAPSGLTGTYADTATFTPERTVRIDRVVDFGWGTGPPASTVAADTFSVRWTGRVLPASDGTWTFHASSDDAVRVWIDGRLVVDDWAPHRLREARGSIRLTADRTYDLRIDYVERSGSATMRLSWSGPGVARQIVPSQRLLAR